MRRSPIATFLFFIHNQCIFENTINKEAKRKAQKWKLQVTLSI